MTFYSSSISRWLAVCAITAVLWLSRGSRADEIPSSAPAPPRLTLSFDKDWRFFIGDPPLAASHAFKDDAWRQLDVPHDWSIEGPFDEKAPTGSAGANLPSGVAWYRKTFTLPASAAGKRVYVEFDGVMANSEVYINNALLGHRPSGYVGLRYDLTDYLASTGPNLLAVRTDTTRQPASRWYAGAGIYRHVRLVIQNHVALDPSSLVITTPVISDAQATIHIHASVSQNQPAYTATVLLETTLLDPDGKSVQIARSPGKSLAGGSATFDFDIPLANPRRWDIATPNLYRAVTRVILDSGNTTESHIATDEETTPFGIRTAEFRADTGFWLNGKNLKLLGVCLHQDAGALGIAVPASAWESRLTALKKLGVNAIRTAHNPPSPEFLDVCDRLGLLVMDEFFDAWSVGKEAADYHLYFKDWWQRDLSDMIARDRNHPSIILYSLGNEIWDILPQNPDPAPDQFIGPMRSIDAAKNTFIPLRDLAHTLDPTRPVTLAVMRPNVSGNYANGFSELVDVIGQNYRDSELAAAHTQNPARKIIGTENYKTRETWLALRDNPALSGQFLWAGVDYLGEAGRWPNVVSPSGLLDRTNFPKGDALERESWWSTQPVLHIVRMKNIPTRPGRPNVNMGFADWTPDNAQAHLETVNICSNCEEAELFLNDQSLGSKPRDPGDAPRQWQVPFTAGTLRAVGKNKGQVVATDELRTAGDPAKIVLIAERLQLPNDWEDIAYVRALVADANGTTNPNATNLLTFKVTGPGVIAAVDNGARADHDPFQSTTRHAFQGTCIAILRATANAGQITLTASADGLAPATVTLTATAPVR